MQRGGHVVDQARQRGRGVGHRGPRAVAARAARDLVGFFEPAERAFEVAAPRRMLGQEDAQVDPQLAVVDAVGQLHRLFGRRQRLGAAIQLVQRAGAAGEQLRDDLRIA